ALGMLMDLLLRATPPGLNVPLVVMGLTAAALLLAQRGRRMAGQVGLLLLAPLFAAGFAWRGSPVLLTPDRAAVVAAVSPAARGPVMGGLRGTGLVEPVGALARAAGSMAAGVLPVAFLDVRWSELSSPGRSRQVGAVARGLAIAVPLVLLFGGLLVAADAAF